MKKEKKRIGDTSITEAISAIEIATEGGLRYKTYFNYRNNISY